jgi:molybdate transport system permease protein
VAAIAATFLALPIVGLVQRAQWSSLWADLTSHAALAALRLSVVCAVAAAVASVVLGTPLAWVLARTERRGVRLLRALVLLPMVLPPVVAGVALLAAFSRNSPFGGWLHDVFGWQVTFSPVAVVMAQTLVGLPFYVITVEAALRALDPGFEEAAASLGASPLVVFCRVTAPLIAPSIAAGAVLAWARALGEFGATLTFAGNIAGRTQTLPLAVYVDLERGDGSAIALSLLLVGVSLAALFVLRDRWLVRR